MIRLTACDDLFSLEDLAQRIRASSNFNFAWQFYHFAGFDPRSTNDVLAAVDAIVADSNLHRFLRDSFQPIYDLKFEIEPRHEHCKIAPATGKLEEILAQAAADHLGAYSKLMDATASEKQAIQKLFGQAGPYIAYELQPGDVPGCKKCGNYSVIFTNWFYSVAWDWCLMAIWPDIELLWVGCLTDTD